MNDNPVSTSHIVKIPNDNPVLFDTVQASGPDGIRFDVWYSNKHLPKGLSSDRLRRYVAASRASYMYIMELDSLEPQLTHVEKPLPASLLFHERCIGRPLSAVRRFDVGPDAIDSAYVYPVFFKVPLELHVEFNRWYDDEHNPMLLKCPQWLMSRRFALQVQEDSQWTHVALHYLLDLRALESPERDAARSTPWRRSLDSQSWFKPDYRVFTKAA